MLRAQDPLAHRPQIGEQVAAAAGSLPRRHAGEVTADDQKAWVLPAEYPLAYQQQIGRVPTPKPRKSW